MRRIVQQGYCLHIVVGNQSPEAIALMEAILDADQAVRKEGVTEADVKAAYDAIAEAERLWCAAHGFKHDRALMMALARLIDNLHRSEARHATA